MDDVEDHEDDEDSAKNKRQIVLQGVKEKRRKAERHLSILGEYIHYYDKLKAYIKASHTIKLLDF